MASVKISYSKPINTVRIDQTPLRVRGIKQRDVKFATIDQTLPFRIKFTAVKVPGITPGNIPAIPLQIIGFSNYIL
jgi:hypothetical protein